MRGTPLHCAALPAAQPLAECVPKGSKGSMLHVAVRCCHHSSLDATVQPQNRSVLLLCALVSMLTRAHLCILRASQDPSPALEAPAQCAQRG